MLNKRATYAALLWLLTMAFAMRVLGQALQRWAPQPLLPPFDAFQGAAVRATGDSRCDDDRLPAHSNGITGS